MNQPATELYPREGNPGGFQVVVASITTTESHNRDYSPLYAALSAFHKAYGWQPSVDLPGVLIDWLSFVHTYSSRQPVFHDGRLIRVAKDGEIVFDSVQGQRVKGSFDSSIYVRCDGQRLEFSGNIGRFSRADNVTGLSFSDCWRKVVAFLEGLGLSGEGLGTLRRARNADGSVSRLGTHLTRVDLTCNCLVSDYDLSCEAHSVSQVFGMRPERGRYGVKWGYTSKRGNWLRAKWYDKQAESGSAGWSPGTLARFEVELRGDWLHRYGLDDVMTWERENGMGDVILGRFASELKGGACAMDWAGLTPSLAGYVSKWRDGQDLRAVTSKPTFYRVRKALLVHGIDIGVPCNVRALTPRIREVTFQWQPSRRALAVDELDFVRQA